MLKRLTSLLISLSLLSACAAVRTTQDTNPAFSEHHYSSHDLDLTWKACTTGQGIRLVGTASNPRYETDYQFFELRVSLLDRSGNTVGQKTFAAAPGHFTGSEPMDLEIPVQPNAQVCQVRFFYTYGIDNGDDRFFRHFNSLL